MYEPSYSQKAPTAGSVLPTDILITQAYSDQTRLIGWDNLLRGRISVFWGKAYLHHKQVKQKCIRSSSTWTSSLIKLLLDYSFSLWEFRNGALHGFTVDEAAAKEFNVIATRIRLAYQLFEDDPFHVPSRWHSLFTSRTIDQRLRQDYDTLQCWLRSYQEAVNLQLELTQQHSEAARIFFKPRTPKTSSKTHPEQLNVHNQNTEIITQASSTTNLYNNLNNQTPQLSTPNQKYTTSSIVAEHHSPSPNLRPSVTNPDLSLGMPKHNLNPS
jgi:hypothetical protein